MGPTEYNPEKPWERQPCDTPVTWALFQDFLSLPVPRRLVDLAKRPGCPLSWADLQRVAWEDGWNIRAEAWDAHLDRLRIQTVERVTQEDAEARARRQGALARKLQTLGELELDKLLNQARRDVGGFGLVQVRDIIRAIAVGVRTERLALGDVTDRIEQGPDLSGLSLDELRQIREMQERIAGQGQG